MKQGQVGCSGQVAVAAADRGCWRGILRAANPSYKGRH